MDKFEKFRGEHPLFVYKSCTVTESDSTVDISYKFSIEGLADFTPSWSFTKPAGVTVSGDPVFERLAFSLGMAEAVSYWKAACPPEVRVEAGELSQEQILWWKKLWFLGLGEFFYVNGIKTDIDSFVDIVSEGSFSLPEKPAQHSLSGCLVPVGGGKDSALTLETLTQAGMKCRCYAINKRCSISATVETAACRRMRSSQQRGTLTAHSSAQPEGLSQRSYPLLHSRLLRRDNRISPRTEIYRPLNEASANESTVAGQEVNHQYSKSFDFEKDFHEYEEKFLRTGIYYFSFLRPLAEFR